MKFRSFLATLILLSPLVASRGWAWGERGHHAICYVASELVQEPGLVPFIRGRGDMLGHLCNIPDILWRGLGARAKIGDGSHYMDLDRLPFPVNEIPVEFSAFFKKAAPLLKSKDPLRELNHDYGTAWWRVDQFFRNAVGAGKRAAAAEKPKGSEVQNPTLPYNSGVFQMLVSMGLMGHFVGDLSMPYHSTKDHDGWESGHGGIHHYYETLVVDKLGLELYSKVFNLAGSVEAPQIHSSSEIVKKMMEFSQISLKDIAKIKLADAVIAAAEPGHPPTRPSPIAAAGKFEPIIDQELARSARVLAELWDLAYREAGKPDLSGYHSYQYPLEPEFVDLDYLSEKGAKP